MFFGLVTIAFFILPFNIFDNDGDFQDYIYIKSKNVSIFKMGNLIKCMSMPLKRVEIDVQFLHKVARTFNLQS